MGEGRGGVPLRVAKTTKCRGSGCPRSGVRVALRWAAGADERPPS